jgi:hypothetical protein
MNRIAWRVGAASTHEVSIVSVHAKPNFELVSYLTTCWESSSHPTMHNTDAILNMKLLIKNNTNCIFY